MSGGIGQLILAALYLAAATAVIGFALIVACVWLAAEIAGVESEWLEVSTTTAEMVGAAVGVGLVGATAFVVGALMERRERNK